MRSLSPTLLAAQKEASRLPYVQIIARNKIAGVVRLDWSRLYTATEPDYFHALAIPGDGSLIRARITPPVDGRKLYRQRVTNPGPSSDFSQWIYLNQYNAVIVAASSLGAEVSIFWIKSDRGIYQLKSTDHGASWGTPELIDYSPTTAIFGIATSYKPNGDIGLFFAAQVTLYAKKRVNNSWQSKVAWDKTTGDLSGVGAGYDGDFHLLLTGKDTGGNFKLWSLIYGDGGELPAGTWSALKEFAQAPAGGQFEYRQVFLAKPDTYRLFFVEKFTGTEAASRPFWSHAVPEAKFSDNLWREPVPFNLASDYGLAIAHHGGYGWLSNPNGVWRAKLTEESRDLTNDVLSLRQEFTQDAGRLTIELDNSNERYHTPGEGELKALDLGCQIEFSPGYVTTQGSEVSPGLAFWLNSYEHTSSGGKASLILYTVDGWSLIKGWQARHQFRWNKASNEMSVKDILAFILGRCGLKLEIKSQSPVLGSYYPDFTIHPGNQGDVVINKLLSFIPDVLFLEGGRACVVNPLASDGPVYSYGLDHPVLEGRYRRNAGESNRIQVEGNNPVSGEAIITDSFSWSEIDKLYDRLKRLEDKNLASVSQTKERGEAYLRQAEIASTSGLIRIPPNCGEELYDVISLTDERAGLDSVPRRVIGIILVYNRLRGDYEESLLLGRV